MTRGSLRAMEGVGAWSRLPEDLLERVLSFLPLPALCRCRSVCKEWNSLFSKASFLDLWERNRSAQKPYLFVTRHLSPDKHGDSWSAVDHAHSRTTCFLDLDERRWYSIPVDGVIPAPPGDGFLRHLAIDDGLLLELYSLKDVCSLDIYDPLGKTMRELPATTSDGGRVVCPVGERDPSIDVLPVLVTVVENADRSFKVFCMNRDRTGLHSGFFVYESSLDAWRALATPPERLGLEDEYTSGRVLEEPAVFFRGNLYAVFWYDDSNSNVVVSYNLEKDLWSEVLVHGAVNPKCPQLMVFCNRMFLALWNIPFASSTRDVFEITEILVEENSSRVLVEIPTEDLEKISGESQFDITYAFPLNSDCVVLISRRTGKMLTYDVRSGAVGALPAHPLPWTEEVALELEAYNLFPHYRARLSYLSMRNILSVSLVPNTTSMCNLRVSQQSMHWPTRHTLRTTEIPSMLLEMSQIKQQPQVQLEDTVDQSSRFPSKESSLNRQHKSHAESDSILAQQTIRNSVSATSLSMSSFHNAMKTLIDPAPTCPGNIKTQPL